MKHLVNAYRSGDGMHKIQWEHQHQFLFFSLLRQICKHINEHALTNYSLEATNHEG